MHRVPAPTAAAFVVALTLLCACTAQVEPERGDASADTAARQAPRTAPPLPSDADATAAVRAKESAVSTVAIPAGGAAAPALQRSSGIVGDAAARWPSVENRERYPHVAENGVKITAEDPVSTFSIDVDTASYSNVRRLLGRGVLPPSDAVRVEELVNYFSYDYPPPTNGQAFSITTEVGPAPWQPQRRLLHIGIQGEHLDRDALPPANLVFLIDVSGSMQSPDKLDLLKTSMKLLTHELHGADRIGIVVYAGAAGAVLAPTPGDHTAEIDAAIDRLRAGGSTNGGAGIQLAYAMARQAFVAGGINRVILATDGDFNVGTTDVHALTDLVARQRKSGVALTVLGFGGGNYNDALMQGLAQAGDGNAAYVDTLNEARKVLVDELAATLDIIARDVKIQVEFNPALVSEYRLLGYETRMLRREDFNNDQVDAGEIGAGHTVTALYEITLTGRDGRRVDPLRYGSRGATAPGHGDELAYVRVRHKTPDSDASTLIERPVRVAAMRSAIGQTSADFRFSAAVAAFGELLRGGANMGEFTYDDVAALARGARGDDASGYRGEFLGLVRTAAALTVAPGHPGHAVGQR